MTKILALALAISSAAIAFQPQAAKANDTGAFIAGTAVGVIGSAIVNSTMQPQPRQEVIVVHRDCWRERQPVVNRYGEVIGSRLVRVCR